MKDLSRRGLLVRALRLGAAGSLLGAGVLLGRRNPLCTGGEACSGCPDLPVCANPAARKDTVWQIDPSRCMQCGRCATDCVLGPSAVKCVHHYEQCGYCDLCSGYFIQDAKSLDTGAENQLCPVGAIRRRFVEDPYFEYRIDEELCVGCGRCVQACAAFGNGSLVLQVRHALCVNCNDCAIARSCPADAFRRVART